MVPKLFHLFQQQQRVQQRVSAFPADLVLLLGGQEWVRKTDPKQRQDPASSTLPAAVPIPRAGGTRARAGWRCTFPLGLCAGARCLAPPRNARVNTMPRAEPDGAAALLGHRHGLPPQHCETASGRPTMGVFSPLKSSKQEVMCSLSKKSRGCN